LLWQQRRQNGTARRVVEPDPCAEPPPPRGAFDRSTKVRAARLGSTGAAHRAFLCSNNNRR
jgi:hypothetical protein